VADAFELAERYRTPVILLADGVLGPGDGAGRAPLPRARRAGEADWALTGADGGRRAS
jgi:pyruvate/2-oxoacid:ferredoxin oxidoreductase alpha subunit